MTSGRRLYSPQDVRRLYRIVAESDPPARRLPVRLTRIVELLDSGHDPGRDEFIDAIGVMIMSESYYTAEQQEQLAERRRALGGEGMAAAERDWAQLIEAVRTEQAAGTDPSDPRMLELASHWRDLIEQFTGGDEGIRQSLALMYRDQGAQTASRGMVEPGLMEYVAQALAQLS